MAGDKLKYKTGTVVDVNGKVRQPGAIKNVSTSATPASGYCDVQFTFTDYDGNAIDAPVAGFLYLSETSNGTTMDLADTSLAVLTNGALVNIGGAGPSIFVTTTGGLLGVKITAAADDYYVVFVLLGGEILISSVCTVNS